MLTAQLFGILVHQASRRPCKASSSDTISGDSKQSRIGLRRSSMNMVVSVARRIPKHRISQIASAYFVGNLIRVLLDEIGHKF